MYVAVRYTKIMFTSRGVLAMGRVYWDTAGGPFYWLNSKDPAAIFNTIWYESR
jgi:hypothetical protein